MSDKISKDCIGCGLCTKNCLFLDKYKMDLRGFEEHPELAYSCFLCGKCKEVCPKNIDGVKIGLLARKKRTDEGTGAKQDSAYKGILWEKDNYKFANYKRGNKKSVLFPGCNFTSFYPKTTKCLENIAKENGMGVVYDCCKKPVYELGLQSDALNGLKELEQKLKARGVEELVMVCPNCYHFMKDKISIPNVTIYEKLKQMGIGEKIRDAEIPIYYPCPDRQGKELFEDITYFLDGEVTNPFAKVQCCGLGGCAPIREGELATKMVEMAEKAEDKMYTYCASCISNYKRKGYQNVYHVLPLILGIQEEVPLGMQPFLNRAKKKFL